MKIDISELYAETKRPMSIILPQTINLDNLRLNFCYGYLHSLPNPYDSYYDSKNQEFHIIIQRDAFMGGSVIIKQEFDLPKETKKIKIDYRGKNLDNLTDEERIEHFFPKLKAKDPDRDENGIDRSGEDGWLR